MCIPAESMDVIERYLVSLSDPGSAYQGIAGWLKAEMATGKWRSLAEAVPRLIVPELDYTSALSLHRVMRQVSREGTGLRSRE